MTSRTTHRMFRELYKGYDHYRGAHMVQCFKCREIKPVDKFSRRNGAANPLRIRYSCLDCYNARQRRGYAARVKIAPPEKLEARRTYYRKWRSQNRDAINAACRARRLEYTALRETCIDRRATKFAGRIARKGRLDASLRAKIRARILKIMEKELAEPTGAYLKVVFLSEKPRSLNDLYFFTGEHDSSTKGVTTCDITGGRAYRDQLGGRLGRQ